MSTRKEIKKDNAQYTSYEELLSGYETRAVTLSSGKMFEVQSLSPGDFMSILGTPIIRRAIENQSITDEDLRTSLELVKEIVCLGVISVKFVNKAQYECGEGEISINRLTQDEIVELYTQIMELSIPNKEEELVNSFQEKNQEGDVDMVAQNSESL